ncbi:hypothetical protein COE18_04075 [Bacillus cereus]|nr:hypothetical protein CN598_25175 [Bacillus wiedmannii]PGW65220.1 hypothetical protein COE18_04075 [Bacillus cereus]
MLNNKEWLNEQVKQGKTLAQVSKELNVTKRTVQNWEKSTN